MYPPLSPPPDSLSPLPHLPPRSPGPPSFRPQVVRLHGALHDGSAEQSVYLLVTRVAATGSNMPEVHLLPDTSASR